MGFFFFKFPFFIWLLLLLKNISQLNQAAGDNQPIFHKLWRFERVRLLLINKYLVAWAYANLRRFSVHSTYI